jgi:Tol biopolymer transport system component
MRGGPEQELPPWGREPQLLTPVTSGLGVLATYVVSAYFAYRALGAFPTPRAFWTLVMLVPFAAIIGYWAGSIDRVGSRGPTVAGAIAIASVLPFALTAWVPGIAQPQQQTLPGGIDLVIAAAPDGNLDLYLIRSGDPENTIELTKTANAQERFPELAPDGRSVVYAADGNDGSTDLYLMNLGEDGRPHGSRLLLEGPGNLSETSWSPDGHDLIVRSDTEDGADLFRYTWETGTLRLFARDAFNPIWSPDGTAVAFAGFRRRDRTDADIFVVDARGRGRRRIVNTGSDDLFPIWSPDGRWIAFAGDVLGLGFDVLVVEADGSELRFLTGDLAGDEEPYLWGPRGDIVFLSDRSDTGGVFAYLMKPDGTDVRLFLRL